VSVAMTFPRPAASAVDLKFLLLLLRVRIGTSNPKPH